MRPLLACLLLAAVGTAFAAVEKSPWLYEGSDVLEVSQAGADAMLALKETLGGPNTRQAHITVFYAHWCGHCQHYAPKFKALAKQYIHAPITTAGGSYALSKDSALRSAFSRDDGAISGVQFYGVNCVKFQALCDAHAVRAYPTIKAFDFPEDKGSLQWLGATLKQHDVDLYLRQHTVSSLTPETTAEASSIDASSLQDWLDRTAGPLPLGLVASFAERLSDLSETIAFLVLVELADRVGESAETGGSVTSLRGTPKANESHAMMGDGGLNRAVRRGVLAQLTALAALLAPDISSLRAVSIQLRLRDPSEDAILAILERRSLEDLHWTSCGARRNDQGTQGDIASGYTCGLWMLLHYLTVAAEPPAGSLHIRGEALSTHRIMALVRALINTHFRCAECRHHFLAAFDGCSWGRCEVGLWDFRALQLWLWTFHNKVTHRIMSYRFMNGQFNRAIRARPVSSRRRMLSSVENTTISSEDGVEQMFPDVLWPSSANCLRCRINGHSVLAVAVDARDQPVGTPSYYRRENQVVWDEGEVVSYLRNMYGAMYTNPSVHSPDTRNEYLFIDTDIDLTSKLDEHGRINVAGADSTPEALTHLIEWLTDPIHLIPLISLFLYVICAYRHVICRWLLICTGGTVGSPRLSATNKHHFTYSSIYHKDNV